MSFVASISQFGKLQPKFVIAYDDSRSHMGADYGPPDPPPQMETENFVAYEYFATKEEVTRWIELNSNSKYSPPKKFKLFEISELPVRTSITVDF